MLLTNRIRTPDGTVIESTHGHDFVTYEDANGHTYSVDGGRGYLKRRYVPDAPYEELSVDSDDLDFSEIREVFKWGTYGKDGNEPLQRKTLASLTESHIKAILETQTHISAEVRGLFQQELKWRGDIK